MAHLRDLRVSVGRALAFLVAVCAIVLTTPVRALAGPIPGGSGFAPSGMSARSWSSAGGSWGGSSRSPGWSGSGSRGAGTPATNARAGDTRGFARSAGSTNDGAVRPGAQVLVRRSDGTVSGGRVLNIHPSGWAAVAVEKNGRQVVKQVPARELVPDRNAGRGLFARLTAGAFHSGDGPFRATPMAKDPLFQGESHALTSKWFDPLTKQRTVVTYLRTPAERAPYKLGFQGGRVVDAKGSAFDTGQASIDRGNIGKAIYVMNSKGEIFASNYQERGKFHHSSLAGGEHVAAAGTIEIRGGRIVSISNDSGHYKPEHWQTRQVIASLKAQGIDTRGIVVTDVRTGASEISH